jgi:hypothetical protein
VHVFTRSDLSELVTAAPNPGVSIFLTTHVRGDEIRQDPVVLKNLVGQARQRLLSMGLAASEADTLLAPALALADDSRFWQHRSHGLAVFLSRDMARHLTMPISLREAVAVGPGFRIRPLLPLLATGGDFHVLTVTEGRIRLFDASRFAMTEVRDTGLPKSLGEGFGEPDYENPVQASPVARPHIGTVHISHAQVYGESPPEWRKTQLLESVRRLAAAVDRRLAAGRAPVVVIANAEIGGHLQKFATLGPLLAGVVDVNPEALDEVRLHEAAYAVVRPRFEAIHRSAAERLTALLGSHDPRAAITIEEVARAAYQGRIDTLLIAEGQTVWGRYDEGTEQVLTCDGLAATGEDLLDAVAAKTLRHGGELHVFPQTQMPDSAVVGAVLRY